MKVNIISGFLGAGKTTLINEMIKKRNTKDKLLIIENEFGQVSVDSEIIKNACGEDVNIREFSSGCICCSIAGNFINEMKNIIQSFDDYEVIIEPSGVAKLSEIINNLKSIKKIEVNKVITVVDGSNFENSLFNYKEYMENQIKSSENIVITKTENITKNKLNEIINTIKIINSEGKIFSSYLNDISFDDFVNYEDKTNYVSPFTSLYLKFMNKNLDFSFSLVSTTIKSNKIFLKEEIEDIFKKLSDYKIYGVILRGKGYLKCSDKEALEVQYTQGELKIRKTTVKKSGQLVIIGENIKKSKILEAFNA